MYRFKWHEEGFTFVEALLHLLLFVVFGHLLFFILIEYYEMTAVKKARIEADWELCVTDISYYFPYGSKVSVSEDGAAAIVKIEEEDRTYNIQFLNNVLWKREKSGNETLLVGVKSARFALIGNRLSLKAKLEDGMERERIFIVEQPSK
ncbi:MAG: hypothetical protein ACI33P_15920 [Lysinibacillus sp.]